MVTGTKPRPHQHFHLGGSRVRDPQPDPNAPKTPGLYPGGCVHHFMIKSATNIGTCLFCDEEVQYPWPLNNNQYAVLKKGNYGAPVEGDPEITKEENTMPTPEQKAKMIEKHDYYEANKEAIIKDLKTFGRLSTKKNWKIPAPSLNSLEARWVREGLLSDADRKNITILGRKLVREHTAAKKEAKAAAAPAQEKKEEASSSSTRTETKAAPAAKKASRTIAATYDYLDAGGQLLFQTVRYKPKRFSQRRPDGQGDWIWNLKSITPVLYHLPELKAAIAAGQTIYIVEGERDADAARSLGLAATTSPMGAGKWHSEYTETLQGAALVALIPDNDEPGRGHMADIAASLYAQGTPVKLLEPLGKGKGSDLCDWQAGGGKVEELEALVAAAPLPQAPKNGHQLPDFPSFNDEWSDLVKRDWFRSYCELTTLVVKGGL